MFPTLFLFVSSGKSLGGWLDKKKKKIFNFLLSNLQILRSVWVFSYEDFIRRVRLAESEWRGKITTSVNVAKVILYKQFSKFYQIFSVAQFSCNAWYIEEVQVTDENIWRKRLLWEFELSLWCYPIYFTFSRPTLTQLHSSHSKRKLSPRKRAVIHFLCMSTEILLVLLYFTLRLFSTNRATFWTNLYFVPSYYGGAEYSRNKLMPISSIHDFIVCEHSSWWLLCFV